MRAVRDGQPAAADSRDTGNRTSVAGLRACAVTRDSDCAFAAAESRVQSVALDAVSLLSLSPCRSNVGGVRQALATRIAPSVIS